MIMNPPNHQIYDDKTTLAPLKRSLDLPFTTNAKSRKSDTDYFTKSKLSHQHKQSFYNTTATDLFDDRLPSPSVDIMQNEEVVDSPPLKSSVNKKRFSLSRLASSLDKKKRGSLANSLNRLSISEFPRKSTSNDFAESIRLNTNGSVYQAENNLRTSMSSSYSMMSTETDYTRISLTPFWKYHVLKFGKDMYLTTNPDLKHVYCRNGPGYYVETIFVDKHKKPRARNGFSLIFKDINNVEKNSPPIMIVTKKLAQEGGYFTLSVPVQSNSRFNALLIPKKISSDYIPPDQNIEFVNYEFKDFNNVKWNVGAIPRVKARRSNKLTNRLSVVNLEPERLKLVGKKNIYFHQNYIEKEDLLNPLNTAYKEKLGDPRNVFMHGSEFPPVLGLFRPYESNARTRIMHAITRQKYQTPSAGRLQPVLTNRRSMSTLNHTNQSTDSVSTLINARQLDHDIGAGSDVKNYYKGGDGLYFSKNPTDDTPDENKLGWITVYEDSRLFAEKGMFDIVLGLTLAAGFESVHE